ncbi:unnamed protein product [Colias eurytheme]|nr:unnamed protein product [Colias eurytheme]
MRFIFLASRHAASVASPSRRPRTVRGSRGGSVSSRHTSSVAAPPPSQRRTEFSTTTERFLRVEEQQLELQRLNSQILQSFLERSAERDKILAEAVAAVGKGLQALAEAKNRDRV